MGNTRLAHRTVVVTLLQPPVDAWPAVQMATLRDNWIGGGVKAVPRGREGKKELVTDHYRR